MEEEFNIWASKGPEPLIWLLLLHCSCCWWMQSAAPQRPLLSLPFFLSYPPLSRHHTAISPWKKREKELPERRLLLSSGPEGVGHHLESGSTQETCSTCASGAWLQRCHAATSAQSSDESYSESKITFRGGENMISCLLQSLWWRTSTHWSCTTNMHHCSEERRLRLCLISLHKHLLLHFQTLVGH